MVTHSAEGVEKATRAWETVVDMTATAQLIVPGVLEQVPRIRHWLHTVLREWQMVPEVMSELILVATEVCTNIIRHGYAETCQGEIDLTVTYTPQAICLTIVDTAPVFEPPHVVSPPPEALAEGGYGLFLIHTLTDELVHERRGERGNCLRLVKYLPASMVVPSARP